MEQVVVFVVLVAALALFLAGRWRYDLVALMALLALVLPGIVEAERAFLGFGHPAVVTVAAVLVISRGLENAGVVELVRRWLAVVGDRALPQVSALTLLVAVFSAFMNNVGALALLMPVAIRMAREHGRPASLFLMPLAFGSLLGGLTTLVGTPPNIIVAAARAEATGTPFAMFDFAPVGAGLTVVGVLFLSLVGWRLLPERKGEASPEELFEIEEYVSEVRIPSGSSWVGRPLQDIIPGLAAHVTVLGIVRGETELSPPFRREPMQADDVLVVEVDPAEMRSLVNGTDLESAGTRELVARFLGSRGDIRVSEAVVRPHSRFVGRTARELELRASHGVNLLGVARQGQRVRGRVPDIPFEPGDVLLLQGPPPAVQETLVEMGGLPLAERGLLVGQRRRLLLAVGLFAAAISSTVAGLLPVQIALTAAAVAMVATGTLTLRAAYAGIDWPVIVLLGAMIPVGEALESTGGADRLAGLLLEAGERLPPEASLAAVLTAALLLSNVINNAAATVLMAPIGLAVAGGLGASPDPFLMAVAVGSSCAFLTPIGHQSNTLVMGPGGYRFGDYFVLGLPVTLLVVAAGIPLILMRWPL